MRPCLTAGRIRAMRTRALIRASGNGGSAMPGQQPNARHPGHPLDAHGGHDERGGRDAVQPEMIRRRHDYQRGDRRVEHRQPPPPAPGRGDHRDGDDQRPADVHRGHRGELVRVDPERAVHRLPVHRGGVDKPGAGEHPRRRDRDELDEQGHPGEQHHGGPDLPVVPAMPGEQPDQAADQHREVQHRVVQVERLDDQRVRQDEPLHGGLAGQVQDPLRVPQPAAPGQAAGRRQNRERPRVLPEREQPEQQRRLTAEPPGRDQPGAVRPVRPAGLDTGHGRRAEAHRDDRGWLPAQFQVRHLHELRRSRCYG